MVDAQNYTQEALKNPVIPILAFRPCKMNGM